MERRDHMLREKKQGWYRYSPRVEIMPGEGFIIMLPS